MWIIYDGEGIAIGTLTDDAIYTTTIKTVLEREEFHIELCAPYRIVEDEWED